MQEPSVWDYIKAKLTPWRGPAPSIPPVELATAPAPAAQGIVPAMDAGGAAAVAQPVALPLVIAFPWRTLSGFLLALIAQWTFEPQPSRKWEIGVILYALAFALLVWAYWSGELTLALPATVEPAQELYTFRRNSLLIALIMAILALLTLGGNRFTRVNLFFWLGSVFFIIRAFWVRDTFSESWLQRLRTFLSRSHWQVSISRWTLLVLGVCAIILFYRLYRLNHVPPEMFSDQAEKLWDVWDVLQGQTKIFFERNTGREGLQMYLTAAVIKLFGTGFSFLSLKIGTTLAGLFTLPFIYLLGKEVGNRRVGLIALALAGIAYWPNVITRVGLRFTLYPAFVAPALYFLIRGLRRSSRNDFILSGIFLGIGLHGYSPIRILPLVVLVAVGLYLLHRQSAGQRKQAIWGLAVLSLVTLIVFLPLLRYWYDEPAMFNMRAFSRVGAAEQPLPGPALPIFMSNLGKAMTMFAWDDGEVWPISVTHRPALDTISAALLYSGMGLLLVRYLRKWYWLDLFWIISIPLLMLPSILSLAFPAENPILNRTAGAIIPVFIIIGLTLDGMLGALEAGFRAPWGARLAWGLAAVLLIATCLQNYNLVFRQYQRSFELSAWNTSELGRVVRDFSETIGSPDTAWVVAYPHWVDTRLVGIHAGFPNRDTAIDPANLPDTVADPRSKLFLIKPEDQAAVDILRQLYPQGSLKEFISRVETKNFLIYFVPPQSNGS